MRHCVTGLRHRYLVSHSKIPNSGDYWKNFWHSCSWNLLLHCNQPLSLSLHLKQGTGCLDGFVCKRELCLRTCLCVYLKKKKCFSSSLLFCRYLCFPSLLKVRPRFIMKPESAGFFPFKKKFSSIWKGGISAYLVWNMFWKIHFSTFQNSPITKKKGKKWKFKQQVLHLGIWWSWKQGKYFVFHILLCLLCMLWAD